LAGFAGFFSGGVFGFGKRVGGHLEEKLVFRFQVSGFRFCAAEVEGLDESDFRASCEGVLPSGKVYFA
jgi:hypothetical protein